MILTIWGAARQVTGSMHLLELNLEQGIYRILIDCGLNHEAKTLAANANFPFNAADIDLVILTHAHIDHSGNLPTLVHQGFNGAILSTQSTADLSYLLMSDSVNIFMSKQNQAGDKGGKGKKKEKSKPLYFQKQVNDCMDHFFELEPNKPFKVNEGILVEFIPVGHLLGAVGALIEVKEKDKPVEKIFFSGDIGRKGYPILEDPQNVPETDYLVCESTYGGRFHSRGTSLDEVLLSHIQKTCIDQPGRLIIPAFSVGRTQALVYSLNRIFSKYQIPKVRVFVDSPLGYRSTEIYRKNRERLNADAHDFFEKMGDEFEFDNLVYTEDVSDSKRISTFMEPCVIISSAGMLEGGRIQEHLYHNISNFFCTILFIGYCAKGTLGRKLLDGMQNVRINQKEMDVYAKIASTDLLSAHADHGELIDFVKSGNSDKLKKVFLVHGEVECMEALAEGLEQESIPVIIPERGVAYELA